MFTIMDQQTMVLKDIIVIIKVYIKYNFCQK